MKQISFVLIFAFTIASDAISPLSWRFRREMKEDLLKLLTTKKSSACADVKCPRQYEECDVVNGKPVCVRRCPSCDNIKKKYDPVCGNDGKTYLSACVLKEVNCMEEKAPEVMVLCKGECPCDPPELEVVAPKLVKKLKEYRLEVLRDRKLKEELKAEDEAEAKKTITVEVKQVPEKADNFMTKEDVEALYSKKMQKWLETKEEFKKKEKASKEVEKNIMNKNLLKKQETCTPEELRELPSRLIDWFHVLKAADRKQKHKRSLNKMKFIDAKLRSLYVTLACKKDPSRPDAEVFCLEPVQWMFDYLDKNKDMVLDHTELLAIEEIPKEHCLKKFFLGCDMSMNGTIEKKEFCRCLCVEPPCTHEMENIPTILVSGVPKPAPNLFIPECDEDGFFMPQQCHKKDCWCVDRNGGEIKGTRVKGSQTKCEDNTENHLVKTTDAPLPGTTTEKPKPAQKKTAFVEP